MSAKRLVRVFGDDEDLSYLPPNFFDIVDQLPSTLLARIPRYYPEVGRQKFSIREVPIRHSSYPIFAYRIQAASFAKDIYVKFAPVFSEKNEGLVEYENLKRVHDEFPKGQGYGSPRPLEFIPEISALITEGVEGISLRATLLRANWLGASAKRRADLKRIVERCGYWLRTFHSMYGVELVECQPSFRPAWVGSWDHLRPWLAESEIGDRVQHDVQRIASNQWDRVSLPVSRKHGDLALDNILVHECRISVLDVSYADRAGIFSDLAHFVANLLTVNSFPRYVLFDTGYARELSGLFLSAYGVSEYTNSHALLRPYLIDAMLERFATQTAAVRAKLGDKLAGAIIVPLCRKYAKLLCEVAR